MHPADLLKPELTAPAAITARPRYWNARRLVMLVVLGAPLAWFCATHPFLVIGIFILLFLAAAVLCFVFEVFSSKPAPAKPACLQPTDAFALLLLAVLFGWWLGGGEGDGC